MEKKINENKKIVVIGGVAAGTSAAVKARRQSEENEIIIYEKYKYISYATCGLPYFVSGKIQALDDIIINNVQFFEKRFKVSVKILNEVIRINPDSKSITVKDLRTGQTFHDNYHKLIIATGSSPAIFNQDLYDAPNSFSLKTIDDALKLKEYIAMLGQYDKNSPAAAPDKRDDVNVVIVGGGYIGLELLEAFLAKGFRVTIIEKTPQVLPVFDFEVIEYLESYLSGLGIKLLKNEEILDYNRDHLGRIVTIRTKSGKEISCDLIFMGTGTKPETGLARDCGLEVGKSGAIAVNEFMQTSDPHIFAAGDCCECTDFISGRKQAFFLAFIANMQGRTAGYNASGGSEKFLESNPTSIIKIMDFALGKTGISFKEAKMLGMKVSKVEEHYYNHATYYPGAKLIHMITVFDEDSGTVLGFEAIGQDGVDKKIDVMSVIIKNRMKIWELAYLNFAYHPEYGTAKDALNIIGMVGQNKHKDEYQYMDVEELKEKIARKEDILILDVRTPREYQMGHIEGSLNIPIDELRQNLDKLDPGKPIVVHCRTSYRSYLAYRILKNEGFEKVWNLNGSYLSFIRKL